MAINQAEEEFTVPIEDVVSLTIEDNSTTVTSQLMRELIKSEVSVFFCNELHVPVGITLPFQNHGRQYRRLMEQITIEKPLQKRLWQKIIQQKISNQARCLELLKLQGSIDLRCLIRKVNSGDTLNAEGTAANKYFTSLFGLGFSREDPNGFNAGLNYGYTIFRGLIARTLVSYGFIPSVGINHHNEYNNFNLADDVIEPFRPVIDLWVRTYLSSAGDLDKSTKHRLINLVNYDVLIRGKKYSVTNAIELCVKSLVSSIRKKDARYLYLPELLPLSEHSYE